MPNWVKNRVYFDDELVLKDMLVETEDGSMTFDFNKVLPMPKELEDRDKVYPINDKEEKKDKELIDKYGADNWYDWRVKNWGTKWNASGTFVIDKNTVEFDTAWCSPEPLIAMITHCYDCEAHVKYADEDLGNNCGEYIYKDGELLDEGDWFGEGDKESYKFACELWGYEGEEYE